MGALNIKWGESYGITGEIKQPPNIMIQLLFEYKLAFTDLYAHVWINFPPK